MSIDMAERKPPQKSTGKSLQFNFETDQETDGRWIAEIPEVPGALAYGETIEEAKAKAYALALYSIADDVERSRDIPQSINVPPIPA
jgi:predicted RNase H-like HicB family nuclease